MVGEADMPGRWSSHGGPPHTRRHHVVIENMGPVGLALALSLLRAGYRVLGSNVSADCLAEFRSAGGTPVAAPAGGREIDWSITCREKPGVRTELLTRLFSPRHEHGRPRLELSGSNRTLEGYTRDAVATFSIGPGTAPESSLHISLDVNPRGPQLLVRGERALFEAALPVLTVLADRVLYAGVSQGDDARTSRGSGREHFSS